MIELGVILHLATPPLNLGVPRFGTFYKTIMKNYTIVINFRFLRDFLLYTIYLSMPGGYNLGIMVVYYSMTFNHNQ